MHCQEFLDLFGSGELGVTVSWAQWSLADKSEVSAALGSGSCQADRDMVAAQSAKTEA